MNTELLHDNQNAVNEEGDVVPVYDIEEIAHLDSDLEVIYPDSIESSLRNHPAAQDMSEHEISKLARDLIDELRQQHKRRRKARAIFAVMRNRGQLTAEDQSAIAVEVGLSADVFDVQHENASPKESAVISDYTLEESEFADYRKAAANDRD